MREKEHIGKLAVTESKIDRSYRPEHHLENLQTAG
jgi:hypothetical protein